ncbi:T9SS type A sorting domain-containing protein, partial [Shewanella algae]|uniref:T9SS type A sorting domain-containing protein n=1 Tax=Shewanella algae TaxID=38313 RepID=UPI003CC7AC1B
MVLYPNPLNADKGMVMLDLNEEADVTLRVIDMQGREQQFVSYSHLSGGKKVLEFQASSLANGAYLVAATLSN